MRLARLTAPAALAALGLLVAPLAADAQQPTEKVYRVGILTAGAPSPARFLSPFTAARCDLGYVEGRNLSIEGRHAGGRPDTLPDLAAELARLGVDVIVTVTTPATAAAKQATATIPVVMVDAGDPVATGLVASLARPGGNVTGLSVSSSEIGGKAIGLLKEAVPSIARIAVVRNPENPEHVIAYGQIDVVARGLGVELAPIDAASGADLDRAFGDVLGQHPDALLVLPLHAQLSDLRRIAAFAVKNRLPTSGPDARYAESGLLIASFPNTGDRFRRLGSYVDRILRGASPADLPVEQPTKLELVVNLKTAKALGLTIPPSLLARADEVIQ